MIVHNTNTSTLPPMLKKLYSSNIYKTFVSYVNVKSAKLSTSIDIHSNTSTPNNIEQTESFSHHVNDILLQDATLNQTNNKVT